MHQTQVETAHDEPGPSRLQRAADTIRRADRNVFQNTLKEVKHQLGPLDRFRYTVMDSGSVKSRVRRIAAERVEERNRNISSFEERNRNIRSVYNPGVSNTQPQQPTTSYPPPISPQELARLPSDQAADRLAESGAAPPYVPPPPGYDGQSPYTEADRRAPDEGASSSGLQRTPREIRTPQIDTAPSTRTLSSENVNNRELNLLENELTYAIRPSNRFLTYDELGVLEALRAG